jgi:deoxyribose-phosphate aldolase
MIEEIKNILGTAQELEKELQPNADHPDSRPVSAWIDHTLLKPEATPDQVKTLCAEAREYEFASVCVNPIFVAQAAQLLKDSPVKVCAVVGFPLGATPTRVKVAETRACLEDGAAEIDMVIPIGMLKAEEYDIVLEDIKQVVETAHQAGAIVKVILEMAYLSQREKIIGCLLSKNAGADFVKTSTGFAPGGATIEDVFLMRRVVGSIDEMGVKAAGGIRSLADAEAMLKVGANRIGASSGVAIAQAAANRKETKAVY